jgi:hypothetical protein
MEPVKDNEMAKNRPRTETVTSTEISAVGSLSFAENGTTMVPRWYPRWCGKPILNGNQEALGFMLGMTGQFVAVFGVLAFIVPALLYLAKSAAGCVVEIPEGETTLPECNKTIHGLKPSSLITSLSSILGITMALFIPVAGYADWLVHRIFGFAQAHLFVTFFCLPGRLWISLNIADA